MHKQPDGAKVWILEPRDPLIARDGRPFQTTPGARATSLRFPYPSTATGGFRFRAGRGQDGLFGGAEQSKLVKQIPVCGPLLVQLDESGDISDWLPPAPADALIVQPAGRHAHIYPLVPLEMPGDAQTNLDGLAIVGPVHSDPAKPAKAPPFWSCNVFKKWLITAADADVAATDDLGSWGPDTEMRTHVAIDPKDRAAQEGALFQTRGLEFTRVQKKGDKTIAHCQRLAMAMLSAQMVPDGLAALGGERRMVVWRSSQAEIPPCPEEVKDGIVSTHACRLVLLTPGCFNAGFLPNKESLASPGVTVTIIGAAVNRAQVISGWDLGTKRAKPVRRLAPAGSVYFLKLTGEPAAVRAWVDEAWLACVSDQEQDCRDGFGLAVLGTWSGKLQAMLPAKEDQKT